MTVYVDVLLAVNYVVNLLLLLLSARFIGVILSKKRLCLAALLGAAGSLTIFFPIFQGFILMLFKCILSIGMVGTAFGFLPIKKTMKAILALMISSFLFAGFILGLQFFWKGVMYKNGVIYFNISAFKLIFLVGAAYALVRLGEFLFVSPLTEKTIWYVAVETYGKQISFHALADTGNCLKEPFSGAPVMICDADLVEKLFSENLEKLRLIPCNTVSGETLLEAFRPDQIQISRGKKAITTNDVYIAKSKTPISGAYEAIFNPKLIE